MAYFNLPTGEMFIPMDYTHIQYLIAVTWAAIWAHFFISRQL